MNDSDSILGLLGFENKKERDDFFIALLVMLLFGWGTYYFGGFGQPELPTEIPAVTAVVKNDRDRDGDGIENHKDKCPGIPGVVENKGCPLDSDNDGVFDKDDKCPAIAGTKLNNGCPTDSDGDGIADNRDKCPKEAGLAENDGCPTKVVDDTDSDEDGIVDAKDKCPNDVGTKKAKGCPDADNDGIADADDKCRTVAGVAANNGCPADKDQDGTYDKDDKCPDVKGGKATKGCPDSDNDGVADKDDKCPNQPARTKDGCPLPDRDGDGILDKDDRCPDVKGIRANRGCPEIAKEDKAIFDEALKGIQFASNSDVLIGNSTRILDKIFAFLKKDTKANLSINGHTDATGNAEANLRLSKDRALACKKYLMKKGIDASRLKAEGFGQDRPVGDNKTLKGRKANRRVEFKPTY